MKYKHITTKKIILVIAAVSCIALYGYAEQVIRISDHFDGKKYFNPGMPDMPGRFFKGLWRLVTVDRADWPDHVKNQPDLHLDENLAENKTAITFVNHSTVLIQLPRLNILTDPVWSERASPISWAGPKRVRKPGIEFGQLPKINIVLITHNHYDHLDIRTIEKLNDKFASLVFVPLGEKPLLESSQIKNIHEVDWWQEITVNSDTTIIFAPAQHWSGRGILDRFKHLWGSYIIKYKNKLIYFGGDAGYSKCYEDIFNRFGKIDIAFLPVGIYEPRWYMKPWHMNPFDAVMAHKDLNANMSIGIHLGTFRLGAEAIDQPIADLKQALSADNIPEDKFIVQKEGQTKIYSLE